MSALSDRPTLEFQGISGGYGGSEIIHDISIRVGAGEIVTLIGPNGAGKSSVMNATFGQLQINGGRILLKGEEITGIAPEQAVRRGISYVPQVSNVFPNLTVQENLEIGAWIRRDDFRPRMEEMFALFPPLSERRRIPAGALSGGQRQMAAMAKALMVDPEILLLDEPTAGLSPRFRGEIFAVVRKVNARGIPILMVEQNARQALGIADRGYVLVDGHCRMEGSGKDLLANPEVGAMFLGRRADEETSPAPNPGSEAPAVDGSTTQSMRP
ncbi:ABC transporter ATP-binding protein [Thioalkalivibrio sp. HK1]|uniref:ABC transporter ATP-binding protein n=1 Tax=Thioalkalivibrio sp. HK1 TaxID=1469245 RepID=UPI000471C6E3|nr:ABC transporter ATP-binding protein [Thioalkalivibrio sp. HK1]